MPVSADKTRMTLTISRDLKAWYEEKADQMGLSMTAFMILALNQMKDGVDYATAVYRQQNNLSEDDFKQLVQRQMTALKNAQGGV